MNKAADKFNSLIELIEQGFALSKACKKVGVSNSTVYEYLNENKEAANKYARACECRADLKFESIEEDYNSNPILDPETGRIDPAWVSLQRLKIDAKKWELSKLMPKKYGDKLDIDHTTKGERITPPITWNEPPPEL